MNPRRIFPLCLLLFISLLIFAGSVLAQESFRWTDSKGRVFYGSTPPKNAVTVEKLPTKGLSRYSSDKMLQRLGYKGQPAAGQPKQPAEKKPLPPARPASLETGEVQIQWGEKNQIISCAVQLRNTGNFSAIEISVAFDFPDGTLVPGVGPTSIPQNSNGDYLVPKELLPLTLHTKGEAEGVVMTPKVIVHAVGE